MYGSITGRHVLVNSLLILREFGAGCYLRCIKAVVLRQRTTFLDCAFRR
jgi:hypothetical protein